VERTDGRHMRPRRRGGRGGRTIRANSPNFAPRWPNVWFLVPGYGAQGADRRGREGAFLPNGLGAVVNSSAASLSLHPDDPDWNRRSGTRRRRPPRN